jgi:mannose-1-phosphate guanylyltransferase
MRWSIVVADDHGPEWAPRIVAATRPSPVQYCRLGASRTLLQLALRRALVIAPAGKVMVTAMQGSRSQWEPSLWFVRAENRFVGDKRSSSLATAAALLSIAVRNPSDIVTILPAKCFVAHEQILHEGIERALGILPEVPEGVVTLGMVDMDEGVDENYLVARRGDRGPGLIVHGYARQPVPWIARCLRRQGAVVASGIFAGYAGVFAAHISRQWPGLTHDLTTAVTSAASGGIEVTIPEKLTRNARTALRALRWHPPSFAQRALPVRGCGWSSLNSARAVARVSEFLAAGAGSASQGRAFGSVSR